MQIVVLAAGLGKRLRPVTEGRSKAMVPVVGRPLVERTLAPWVAHGLTEAVFVVGPDDEEIRARFGVGNDLGIAVRFVVQLERRGMAHALDAAAHVLTGDFVVTACDSMVTAEHVGDLLAAHETGSTVLSLLDVTPEQVCRSAAVKLDGDEVRQIIEKPAPGEAPSNTVSLPHYILPERVLELLPGLEPSPRGEVELQSALQDLIDDGDRVVGVRALDRVQVSDAEDLRTLNLGILASGEEPRCVVSEGVGGGVTLNEPLRVEDGVVIGCDSEIGPNAYLEKGCVVGDRVVISDSVVLRGVRVADGRVVAGELLA